jgi:hypothetical protein
MIIKLAALKHELFGRPTVVKNQCKALLSGSPVVPTHCARLLPVGNGDEQNEVRVSFDKVGDHLLESEIGSGTVRSWTWSQGKWMPG